MGIGSFLRVKKPECGIKVKERVELYLYSASAPSWHVIY
jgi:hypothetical protein